MRGVILAGGEGTRLYPATKAYNKHAAIVYDRPMLYYPLDSLRGMGVDEPIVVSGPRGSEDLRKVLDGPIIRSQATESGGSPQALLAAEDLIDGIFPVLCGDVFLDPAPPSVDRPTLFWHEFEGAQNHSVWNPETNEIIEKPVRDIGKRAIIAYVFDRRVFEVIRNLKPSDRGELELADIYKWYLKEGIDMVEYKGVFIDMGTPQGLLRAANYVAQR